jgi:hypothetical protein
MDTPKRSYHATFGPDLEPIRHFDTPRMLSVVAPNEPIELVGSAQLVGWMFDEHRPIATYRLTIGGHELSGLYTCVGRRFELVVP